MPTLTKDEYEQLCERVAIEVEHLEPEVAQAAYEFRVAKAQAETE
jgi:hypothetical protein